MRTDIARDNGKRKKCVREEKVEKGRGRKDEKKNAKRESLEGNLRRNGGKDERQKKC